tara:strand:- start:300 stop:401 length:102 start_codon:yes stop_codon:yes gene_type:complete
MNDPVVEDQEEVGRRAALEGLVKKARHDQASML